MLIRQILYAAILCVIAPSVASAQVELPTGGRIEQVDFERHVMGLLSKTGCNAGSCHGSFQGKNGFRLSLRGYAPDQDYKWITREFDGRRLDPAKPEASLLLLKATAQAPHEGGRLFGVNSREYQLLAAWIKAGFPGPDKADAKVSKLELSPADAVLKPGADVQLVATATFSDGSRRDVTWLTKFESNDAAYP